VSTLLGQSRSQSHPRDPFDALVLGVFLHGYAADRVAARTGRVGYIAGDLIDELPAAIEAIAR
jgi:NAD(P)H-hydrate repair Nnr-like enzyme with NAD(P)H-hydrate dehydratase domain